VDYLLKCKKMKPCHSKSEYTAVGVFSAFNEILEAIIDDYADITSAARTVSLHKCLVGKLILVA